MIFQSALFVEKADYSTGLFKFFFLFLLYINDSPDCIPVGRIALFADDTSLYNFGPEANEEICNNVKTARSWFKDNKVTINTDKCETLSFGTSEPFPFEAFGAEIRSQTHCKYLGVYLDAKLTFKKHIEHITKKLNKFCGIVYRIRDRFLQKDLISFYYAYAQSVITYGLINYDDLLIKRTLKLSTKLSGHKEFSRLFSTDDNGTLYKTFTRNINFSMSTKFS